MEILGYIAAELFEEHVFRHLVPLLGNAGLRADALGVVLELISDGRFISDCVLVSSIS